MNNLETLAGLIAIHGIKSMKKEHAIGVLCHSIGVSFKEHEQDFAAIKMYQAIETAEGLKPLTNQEGAELCMKGKGSKSLIVAILMEDIVTRVLAMEDKTAAADEDGTISTAE